MHYLVTPDDRHHRSVCHQHTDVGWCLTPQATAGPLYRVETGSVHITTFSAYCDCVWNNS